MAESAKKRGRPRTVDTRHIAAFFPELSRRGTHEKAYQGRAVCLLRNRSEFIWLFEGPSRRGSRQRNSILGELGRFESEEELELAARAVCERRPTARVGVFLLRRLRLAWKRGQVLELAGDPADLANRLVRVLNGYRREFPETPLSVFRQALGMVEDVLDG